jgi:hypothetical protein
MWNKILSFCEICNFWFVIWGKPVMCTEGRGMTKNVFSFAFKKNKTNILVLRFGTFHYVFKGLNTLSLTGFEP